MSRPLNRRESILMFERNEEPKIAYVSCYHIKWLKNQMVRVRRRYFKKVDSDEYN